MNEFQYYRDRHKGFTGMITSWDVTQEKNLFSKFIQSCYFLIKTSEYIYVYHINTDKNTH